MVWRERLSEAINRCRRSRRQIAKDAGVSLAHLTYILTDERSQPTFETVTNITHAAGENVGWLLGEGRYPITKEESERMRSIINFLDRHFPQLDIDGP